MMPHSEQITTVLSGTTADESNRLMVGLFAQMHEGLVISDARGTILDVNHAFSELTGYSREEAVGQNAHFLQSGHGGGALFTQISRALIAQGYWQGEVWNRHKDGHLIADLLTLLAMRDENGATTHYIGLFSDIATSPHDEQHLRQMAYHDALTKLPNRVLLLDRLQSAMTRADRQETFLAVCYLDLDGFKPINDVLGHAIGDQLLIGVAERLRGCVRESDTVARLGGDEFVVLLADLARIEECHQMLDRLLHVLAEPFVLGIDHSEGRVTASLGVTLYPQDRSDSDTLLRHADQAMYLAKQAGRNRYLLFDAEHDRKIRQHGEQLACIEAGLDAEEFCIYVQPKVNMRQGKVIGAEALVRWQHPERGLLPPAEFLPVIEGHRLMVRLDHWVFCQSLREMEHWQTAGLRYALSINVSATTLQQNGFSDWLAARLAEHPTILPQLIELEIVESVAFADLGHVLHTMEACHQLGVGFALDDFGTGYSSLTYFRRLPVRTLKVDQSFVRNMLAATEDMTIVEVVINLANTFRRRVVAEGVETALHGMALLQLGCHDAQGYGIARPMPAAAFPEWARRFTPHPLWAAGTNFRGLLLLSIEAEHRTWVRELEDFTQGAAIFPPEIGDLQHCRLGRWCAQQGVFRYGDLAVYHRVEVLHAEFHKIAQALIEMPPATLPDTPHPHLIELYAVCDALVEQLYELQKELLVQHVVETQRA